MHIFAGFSALVSGGISFTAPKGRKLHTGTGNIYTLAMLVVAGTAFVMCLLKYNPFLFTVGIFSLYLTLTGYRSLQHYKSKGKERTYLDWLILSFTFLLAGGFTLQMLIVNGLTASDLQPVLFVFMGILAILLMADVRLLTSSKLVDKGKMLRRHIGRMGGAYISTFTAFLVTNVDTNPAYISWLLPTAIGFPFIAYFIRRYSPKKKATRQTTSV